MIPGKNKLILIFTEIQLVDDPVQLILPIHGVLDGTADLVDKVILEMLYGGLRLLSG